MSLAITPPPPPASAYRRSWPGSDEARPRGCDVPKHAPRDVQGFSLMCDVSTPRSCAADDVRGAHHPQPVPMRMGRTLTDLVEG